MKFVTQSRTGKNGTCFRSCIASILNLEEKQVPDFKKANLDPGVDGFLKKYGLSYKEIPAEDDNAPLGLHLALGTSPRGGQHAVVAENGSLKWDPHPQDGTGRGLVDVKSYGLLLPLKGGAKDAAPLQGKRLQTAAEKLYEKHDEIDWNLERREWLHNKGPERAAYVSTHQGIVALVNEAASLLDRAKLDDDPAYWQLRLQKAKDAVKQAEQLARSGDYKQALAYQEGAFTLAHIVIDKMRNSGKARDAANEPPYKPGDVILLPGTNKRAIVAKVTEAENLFGDKEYHVATKTGEVVAIPMGRAKAKDSGPCLTCGKATKGTEHFCSAPCEEQWIAKKYPRDWADMKKRGGKLALDKRARMHRALDCVMDRSLGKAKDSGMIYELDLKGGGKKTIPQAQFQAWLKKSGEVASSNFRERAEQLSKCTGLQVKDWSMEEGGAARDSSQSAHVGMLGVNADKAQALKRQLERKGFEYRFPAEPPKEDIVRHAFRKGPVGEGEWRILNERKNGYHNITEMR